MPKHRADDVLRALRTHYPSGQYIVVDEVPQYPDSTGRRVDFLALGLWASRGYERHGVEVKVDRRDWIRERDSHAKATPWFNVVHQFWLAVPNPWQAIVHDDELPSPWGLLEASFGPDGQTTVTRIVKAPKNLDPDPLNERMMLAIMRRQQSRIDARLETVRREAHHAGLEDGLAQVAAGSEEGRLRRQLDDLQRIVAEFEAASGVQLSRGYGGGHIGAAVSLALNWKGNPRSVSENIRRHSADLREKAEWILRGLDELGPLADALASAVRGEQADA